MTVSEFKSHLLAHEHKPLALALPDGGFIPAHFHITEVGHVQRNFIDCGGTRRRTDTCLLQTWVASDEDHRLHAGKLAGIFAKAKEVLPDENLPVEIEYEDYVVSQFPVTGVQATDGVLLFTLGLKHTDCLAKELCLPGGCCTPDSGCCA